MYVFTNISQYAINNNFMFYHWCHS